MITNRYVIPVYEACELIDAWGSKNAALLAAIVECTNRARLYIVPCSWAARFLTNGEIVVTRKHSSPKGK